MSDPARLRRPRFSESSPVADVVRQETTAGARLPVAYRPAVAGVRFDSWAAANWSELEAALRRHGALVFSGFAGMDTVEDFRHALRVLAGDLSDYTESATPRKDLGDGVYSSTEFPAEETIAQHNELSAASTFPLRLWFFCEEPPTTGGATPISDGRAVLRRIDGDVLARFRRQGWLLVRNIGQGFGLPWPEVFHTEDAGQVEAYCRQNDIQLRWLSNSRLETRQRRSAVVSHPATGEEAWFNHVAFWSSASLAPELQNALLAEFPDGDLPFETYYGDGTRIEPDVIRHLNDAYAAETVARPWQRGDVMVLDNILTTHGRQPYAGARRVRVSMSHPHARPACQWAEAPGA
jgi:alpha-ketoglutarate-dependent taurine dioxygenase